MSKPTVSAMRDWIQGVNWPFGIEVRITGYPWTTGRPGHTQPPDRVSIFFTMPITPLHPKPWMEGKPLEGTTHFPWPEDLDTFKEHVFLVMMTATAHEILEQMSHGGVEWMDPHYPKLSTCADEGRDAVLERFTTEYLELHIKE